MAEYTDEALASKTFGEMYQIRKTATNQEEANRYGNFEHRAYVREGVQENPANLLAMPVAIPVYAAGKATGVIKGSRSETSVEQMKQAYIGYGEGVVQSAKDFFGQDFSATASAATEEVKKGVSKTLEFFGVDFGTTPSPPLQKPPVEPVKAPRAHSIDTIFPALIQAESKGMHLDEQGRLVRSKVGAEGITQLMPKTAAKPGYGITPAKDKSEAEYLRVGKEYLQKMYDKFGDWEKALAAYNAGVGTVMKAEGKAERFGGDWKEHLPKKEETLPYIKKIMKRKDDNAAERPV